MPIGSGDQTTVFGESAWRVHRWQSVLGRKSDDRLTIYDRRGTGGHNQTTIRPACEIRDGTLNLAASRTSIGLVSIPSEGASD